MINKLEGIEMIRWDSNKDVGLYIKSAYITPRSRVVHDGLPPPWSTGREEQTHLNNTWMGY